MLRRDHSAGALIAALALALAVPAAAQEQPMVHETTMPEEGLRAELIEGYDAVEEKYLGLAEAMRDHYDWRPGEGVRSVSEVFMHVAAANYLFPSLMGIEPPEELQGEDPQATMEKLQALEQVSDPGEVMQALRDSFTHLRHAVAQISDERLDEPVTYFGQQGTARELVLLATTHLHEHLGQAIAYARTNGVVPPWSAATGQ